MKCCSYVVTQMKRKSYIIYWCRLMHSAAHVGFDEGRESANQAEGDERVVYLPRLPARCCPERSLLTQMPFVNNLWRFFFYKVVHGKLQSRWEWNHIPFRQIYVLLFMQLVAIWWILLEYNDVWQAPQIIFWLSSTQTCTRINCRCSCHIGIMYSTKTNQNNNHSNKN